MLGIGNKKTVPLRLEGRGADVYGCDGGRMKYIIIERPRPYGTSQVRHSFGKLKFPLSQSSCQRVIGSLLAITDERSLSSPKEMILSALCLLIK